MKAPLSRLEAALLTAALVLFVLGLTVSVLTTSAYVRTMVRAVDAADLTGLGEEQTLDAADAVRRFVTDRDAPTLPPTIAGEPAFDEAAVSHLVDVREVVVPARSLTVALLVVLGVWAALRVRTARGRRTGCGAAKAAAVVLTALVALAAVAGTTDFVTLFARFHAVFFAEGTWVFPADALLIRVFPLPFWAWSAAIWGALVLLCAAGLWVFGRRLRFTEGTYGV